MAVASRPTLTDLHTPKLWKDKDTTSPEHTKVWTEPKLRSDRKVPVVYYLSRNGLLEHPHFIEVPLSSSEGLYLRFSEMLSIEEMEWLGRIPGLSKACKVGRGRKAQGFLHGSTNIAYIHGEDLNLLEIFWQNEKPYSILTPVFNPL